jgi:hypothetical protein
MNLTNFVGPLRALHVTARSLKAMRLVPLGWPVLMERLLLS